MTRSGGHLGGPETCCAAPHGDHSEHRTTSLDTPSTSAQRNGARRAAARSRPGIQAKRHDRASRAAVVGACRELARRAGLDALARCLVPGELIHRRQVCPVITAALDRADQRAPAWLPGGLIRPERFRDLARPYLHHVWAGAEDNAPGAYAYLEGEVKRARKRWLRAGESIETCGTTAKVLQCHTCAGAPGRLVLTQWCMSRYCPTCCRMNRDRSRARIEQVLGRFKNRVRFLTLTVRSERDLVATRRRLSDAWKKWQRRAWVRERLRGGIAAQEVTYSASHGWHPHLHVCWDGDYLPRARAIDEWMSCTGCTCARSRKKDRAAVLCCRSTWSDKRGEFERCTSPDCRCTGSYAEPTGFDVREAGKPQDMARELGKYCAKEIGECQPNLPPLDLVEFIAATWGRRLLTTFGCHYDPELDRLEAEIDFRAMREEWDPELRCPTCDSTGLEFVGFERTAVARPPPQEAT